MGEFLAAVTAKKDSPAALAHRVALLIDKSSKKALLVEAGEDYFVYGAFIRRMGLAQQLAIFSANGKPKALLALDSLSALGKAKSSFAVVDRDFDFDLPSRVREGRCFVLDEAAVENIFLDDATLKDIGRNFFALEEGSIADDQWTEKAAMFKESLETTLLEEHATAFHCIKNQSICNLNNVNANDLTFEEKSGAVRPTADAPREFLRMTSAVAPDADELETLKGRLSARPVARWYRGHYAWQMLVRLLNTFRIQLDEKARLEGANRGRTRVALSERHALEAASSIVVIPQSLSDFLREAFA